MAALWAFQETGGEKIILAIIHIQEEPAQHCSDAILEGRLASKSTPSAGMEKLPKRSQSWNGENAATQSFTAYSAGQCPHTLKAVSRTRVARPPLQNRGFPHYSNAVATGPPLRWQRDTPDLSKSVSGATIPSCRHHEQKQHSTNLK